MLQITSPEFKQTIQSNKLSVISFGANWCGPCKAMLPLFEEISILYNINVAKIDVDEEFDLASEYKIISVPTIFFFKNGKQLDMLKGSQTKPTLIKKIESFI